MNAVGDTSIRRPSHAILNSGLNFTRFVAPFTVVPPLYGRAAKGFISVGDALDHAVIMENKRGGAWGVLDAEGEHVYTVER